MENGVACSNFLSGIAKEGSIVAKLLIVIQEEDVILLAKGELSLQNEGISTWM